MDEAHLLAAAAYVELNPVRAGLAMRPEDWRWSSARAHLGLRGEGLGDPRPLLERHPDWRAVLDAGLDGEVAHRLRAGERSGRAQGGEDFLDALAGAGHPARRPGPGRPRRERG